MDRQCMDRAHRIGQTREGMHTLTPGPCANLAQCTSTDLYHPMCVTSDPTRAVADIP